VIVANKFLYDNNKVIGYDKKNPLSKSQGKVNILKELKLKGEVHVIGDGYTDYEIKKEGLANYFYLFIENIKRESVVKSADYLLKSLDQFIKIIK
jgi:D-3-phosphoglycerate dehydrogenase